MDSQEFRRFAGAAVDYVADYLDHIRDRPVLPSVEPGYLRHLVPDDAPEQPESWRSVLDDVERVIMPGMTHWHSPQFHAYYPTANSYPAIVAGIISDGLGVIGFSWMASPACTELEMLVTDWLAKMLDLPRHFLNHEPGPGGGVIQGSASEATLVALLAARERTVRRLRAERPDWDKGYIQARLVSYSSDQSNSSVEKAGMLGSVPMRLLATDNKCRLRGPILREAIRKDKEAGFIPCCVVANLGTTGTCAFDALEELGPICEEENVWLHVDAAYAGAAFICPEFRHLMAGVELADSFNFNPHKWMLVNFDCSAMWVKDSTYLVDAFNVDRIYLKHDQQGQMPDYRHWQIPLGRRFRSLKLWFVLRLYGVQGLQSHIRKQVALAKQFEDLVRSDHRFEIVSEHSMGLVCFRLKGEDDLTKTLLERLTARQRVYMIPTVVLGAYALRFVVCSRLCELRDVQFAWQEVRDQALLVLGPGGEVTSAGSAVSFDVDGTSTNGHADGAAMSFDVDGTPTNGHAKHPNGAAMSFDVDGTPTNGNIAGSTTNGNSDETPKNNNIGPTPTNGQANVPPRPLKAVLADECSSLTGGKVNGMTLKGGGNAQTATAKDVYTNGGNSLQNGSNTEVVLNGKS
ncbi:aromatic-L-amino-acid decarboxylase-like [Bacillus rossius redtenbacheri]|uniref:aromatic-L-amino-acid decarboxylase-like n=1 Tax=Bacillus rossius redtenbacheri TaxID=93214 RepID=UPI002FDDF476